MPGWMWPIMIAVMAAGLALGAVALHGWRSLGETSVVTQSDTTRTRPSPASVSPAPSGSATSSAQPSPGDLTVQTAVTHVTTSRSLPSDLVIGTMLGLSAILILTGALLPRVTKIVLPGGGEIDTAPLASAAALAVSRQAAAAPTGGGRGVHPAAHPAAAGAAAAAATALTLTRARRLLADPQNVGDRLGLSPDQIAQVRRRVIAPPVWDTLAKQALDDVGQAGA
jgi:hypothetical protein